MIRHNGKYLEEGVYYLLSIFCVLFFSCYITGSGLGHYTRVKVFIRLIQLHLIKMIGEKQQVWLKITIKLSHEHN